MSRLDTLANDVEVARSRKPAADELPDNSPEALRVRQAAEDQSYRRLLSIGTPGSDADRITHDMLKETLEAERGLRICRREYWNMNHISGWHIALPALAAQQDVTTSEARKMALRRWAGLPGYIDREIANLRLGLGKGYSVPVPIVTRVIGQLDNSLALPVERNPYFSPAARSADDAFKRQFHDLVAKRINPALARYRDYLEAAYLPRARDTIAVSALPDGRACYSALLRRETTLLKTPRQVFDEGQELIRSNRTQIESLGRQLFGESDFLTITGKAEASPENKFQSAKDSLSFIEAFVARARKRSEPLFLALPEVELAVQPFPDYQRGSGMNPYYKPAERAGGMAHYMVNPESWKSDTRGFTEVVAVHEGWPGHHVQVSVARSLPYSNRFRQNAVYGAFAEGWARYIERLADEQGIYESPYARIAWRIKPGIGMVVDPGIHWLDWSRADAAAFLKATGLFPSEQGIQDFIDRITVMPGQLTAYDAGGNEFVALRDEARRRLGSRFDLARFHEQILSVGFVPLSTLHRHIVAWIDETARDAR
ncbi:DUF885 domain-containing protein [Sphingosinicella sp. GR2756]|uniref:DUF885 domain-containing protein n=1 Tax=Sphingosinicella rhizophila TaxID=3050082 RepID=A0ABU3Q508_9SPHN|nr:DUF885 domain-containing protein [Sphingosinicella sp. GR2756]